MCLDGGGSVALYYPYAGISTAGMKGVNLTAYNIEGNNYFKLRDIGNIIDFGVAWNGLANTIASVTLK